MKTSLQSNAKLSSYISIDRILELLRDIEWHSLEEIQKEIALPSDKLNEVLYFLQKQALIDREEEKLRITSTGLKFLQLKS
jgi:predicted transcriptional regulator